MGSTLDWYITDKKVILCLPLSLLNSSPPGRGPAELPLVRVNRAWMGLYPNTSLEARPPPRLRDESQTLN